MRRWITISIIMGALAAAPVLWASDGCVEISQVNVATAGNITSPGCYVLTSDLTQGLTISASGVVLDLNGFQIEGSTAITLPARVDNLKILNGTLVGHTPNEVIHGAGGVNHVFERLEIHNGAGKGIEYVLDSEVLTLSLERVVVATKYESLYIWGRSGDVEVTRLFVDRSKLASVHSPGLSLGGTTANSFVVYGFELQSTVINGAVAGDSSSASAVDIEIAGVTSPEDEASVFSGAIRDCELSIAENGVAGVYFSARLGTLSCTNNTVIARPAATASAQAFKAPGTASLVIRDNTSFVRTPGGPVSGNVISPPVGHDGTNPVLSNWNDPGGAY